MSLLQGSFVSLDGNFLEVAERIKAVRGSMTQAVFADRLLVARKTVVRWEAGEALPDGASLLALLREFSADPVWVLTGARETKPSLTAEEQRLVALFRLAEPAVRKAVVGALAVGEAPEAPKRQTFAVLPDESKAPALAPSSAPAAKTIKRGGITVHVAGGIGQQVEGGIHSPQTFNMGGARGRKPKGS